MTKKVRTTGPSPEPGQVATAMASTDCPKCQGFVSLIGQGYKGQEIKLTGTCPNGHFVFFNHTVQ
jgi:hypothetical protein